MRNLPLYAVIGLLCVMGVNAALQDGLVAYYPMGNTSDMYLGRHNLTVNGTPTNDTACKNGNCYLFSTNSQWLNTTWKPTSSSSFTINFWYRQTGAIGTNNNGAFATARSTSSQGVNALLPDDTGNSNNYLKGFGANNTTILCFSGGTDGNTACRTARRFTTSNMSMFTFTYNSTTGNASIYVNGTIWANKTFNITTHDSALVLMREYVDSTSTIAARAMDEVAIFNTTKTASEVDELWNGSSGNFAFFQIQQLLTISATNAYNGTAINAFNATVTWNGTTATYSTTNGTIFTNATRINATLPANITVQASQHFQNDTTGVTSNSHAAALNPWTAIRALYVLGGAATTFSVNYTNNANTSEAGTATTTTGIAFAPLYNATYTLSIYDASNSTASFAASSANVTADPYNRSYNFTSYITNTFSLAFYNETSDLPLAQNVTVLLISADYSVNYTVGNTTTFASTNISLLVPADYEIQYWYDANVPRSYFVTLTNQSYTSLRLYTIDYTDRELYSPVVQSRFGRACSNQTVSLLRYFVNGNAYRIVEMGKTDTNGAAVFAVQPNIINYKFQFAGACGDFTSDPQKITDSSNSFTVSNAQSPLVDLEAYGAISRSLTFTNSTLTFVFNWADAQNLVESGCLDVTRTSPSGSRATVYSACNVATSGSLIYTLNDTNQTIYTATSTINLASGESFTDTATANFRTAYETWGLNGVFLTLVVLIAFATLGSSPDTTNLYGVIAMVLMGVFGVMAWNWTYFVGIVIIAAYLLYKTGRT